jgi:ankyrin repeat protein
MTSDAFIRLACLVYGDWHPSRAAEACQLLIEQPELGRADLYGAAAAGDVAAARTMLADDPSLVNRKGGPFDWEPLLYACYSRLDGVDADHSTLDVARLLLAAGADPDAGFLLDDNVPPFTALTGAFGEGEDGSRQPPHPQCEALARLLLDAGADPNDGQTLYNRHFRPDDSHLRLLLAYGLGHDKQGTWYRRLGDRMQSPARLLAEELWAAARKGYFARVKLLVEHGVNVNTAGLRDQRTPYEAALRMGHHEIADYLLQHGATKLVPSLEDQFGAALVSGRRAEAQALIDANPGLLETLSLHRRIELLHRAVEGGHVDGVRLMSDLGFDLNLTTHHDNVGVMLAATPLHNAAWFGNLPLVQLLLDLGADPTVRDPNYDGTPRDWAEHNGRTAVAEYLAKRTVPTKGTAP